MGGHTRLKGTRTGPGSEDSAHFRRTPEGHLQRRGQQWRTYQAEGDEDGSRVGGLCSFSEDARRTSAKEKDKKGPI